jgi:DNA-directed RNA polymerase alpha subunit
VVYDPEVQTCLFDGSWSTGSQDRRRLGASRDGFCEAVEREDLDKLKTELKTELQASHARELKKLEDRLSKQEDRLSKQQAQTNALLEKQEDRLSKQQAQTNALLEKLLNHTGSGM